MGAAGEAFDAVEFAPDGGFFAASNKAKQIGVVGSTDPQAKPVLVPIGGQASDAMQTAIEISRDSEVVAFRCIPGA